MKTYILSLGIGLVSVLYAVSQETVQPSDSGLAPVNGLDLYYEVYGEGDPVVLLHGAYMTIGLNWGQFIPVLSRNKKVIAVEMQGHGRTADIDRPFNYKDLAADVAGLLKHLGIDKADIIGYSFGGTIAFKTAIDYPEMIDKMVIISSVYKQKGWMPEVLETLHSFEPSFLDNTPLRTEYERIAPDPGNWISFVKKFMKFDVQDYDFGTENIKNIRAPFLFIMGDNDGVDLDHITEMYRLCGGSVFGDTEGLPESQLAILPGKTHVGLIMDAPQILSFVQPFLDNVPAQDSSIENVQH